MRRKAVVWMFIYCLTLAATFRVAAQTTSTTLIGTVTDKTGAVLVGARVTATNADTNFSRSAQTNDQGEYRVEFLPVGNYMVEVTATGFKKFVEKGIVLQISQVARVDLTMDVGAVTESVNVVGAVPLVNTSNAEIGRTVENAEVDNLPIVNRNVYTLLSLTPGVQSSVNTIVLGYPEQRTLIHGGADGGAGSVSYYLDGGTNMTGLRNTGNILPNPDAIQEFRVDTNNYNAEYGRSSGGVVTAVTKSGTNNLHGSLFEFYRDTAFNANTWGNLGATPPLHRNQFGGTVGGPIKKDKTFFFFAYQGLRQKTSAFLTGAVPTSLERGGDFSKSIVNGSPVVLPSQYTCAPNVIFPALLDKTATNILSRFIPGANVPGTNIRQDVVPSPFNTDDYLIKVDHALTSNQRLTASYFETSGNNLVVPSNSTTGLPNGTLPWSQQQFTWRQHNAILSDTWTISPTLVNQVWLGYTRNFGGRLNLPQTSLGDLGSAFTIQGTSSLPQITVTGLFTLAQAIAGPVAGTNMYSARDVVSFNHGRHALSFGAEVSLDKDIQQTLLNNYGVFDFNSTAVRNNATGKNTTVPSLANFELGLPTRVSQDSPVNALDNFWTTGFFAQDNFRIHPRLTLNLGLRWDIQTPPTDPQNREATFISGVQSTVSPTAPTGRLFVGDPGVTRGTIPIRWHHVSPRVGLAWDPFGNGKTAIRAGVGVFYGSISGNEWNTTTNFLPFATRFTFTNVTTTLNSSLLPTGATLSNPYNNLGGGNPFPYNYSASNPKYIPGGSIFGFAPNFQWPYTYQLNFSVQRQITSDFAMMVAYVGALSHNLPFATDLNYPRLVNAGSASANPSCSGALGPATASNVICRRPIDNPNLGSAPSPFGQVLLVQSNQTASYHGLQVTAEKRMSHRIMVRGFYTFSKTLDSVQLQNTTTQGGAQNFAKLSEDRGREDFDIRHTFVTSLIWRIDYYTGRNAVVRGVLNGWSVSPIVTLRSGLPFTILNGRDANLDGNGGDRAQLVPGMNAVLDPHRSRAAAAAMWFNPFAFAQNPATPGVPVDGSSPRNFLDGPGFRNVDLAIFRDFKLLERLTLQTRLEATNAFNLVSLSNPAGNGATVGSNTFGQILTANPMRQVQLGLRLTF